MKNGLGNSPSAASTSSSPSSGTGSSASSTGPPSSTASSPRSDSPSSPNRHDLEPWPFNLCNGSPNETARDGGDASRAGRQRPVASAGQRDGRTRQGRGRRASYVL